MRVPLMLQLACGLSRSHTPPFSRLGMVMSIALIFVLTACVTTQTPEQAANADSPLIISTLDLYAQQDSPKGGKSWQGDWEFRRDRLEVVDNGLRDIRPDIAVFQNALERSGSSSEADKIILSAGALSRYEWHDIVIDTMKETGEDRTLAVAVAKPFGVEGQPRDSDRMYWQMGADGHLAFFNLTGLAEPILLVNVLMPSKRDQVGLWYSFVQERIMERLKSRSSCLNRIVIAGYLPVDQDSRRAREFMEKLRLRDSGMGFCQNAERCQTATSSNELFVLSRKDEDAGHVDRILVPHTAGVLSAGLAFTKSVESTQYKENYGLTHIFASVRFGWTSRVRLAACGISEN